MVQLSFHAKAHQFLRLSPTIAAARSTSSFCSTEGHCSSSNRSCNSCCKMQQVPPRAHPRGVCIPTASRTPPPSSRLSPPPAPARVSPPPSSRTRTPPRLHSHAAAALLLRRCRCSRSLPRRRPSPALQAATTSTSGRSRGRCGRKARRPPGGGRRPPPPPLGFPGGRILQRGSSFSSFPRRPDLAAGLLLFFLPPAAGSADPGQCGLRGARPGLRLRFPFTAVAASSSATGSRPRLARLAADNLLLLLHPSLCCYCPHRRPCSAATGPRRRPRSPYQGL
jgi:hypothetical protein